MSSTTAPIDEELLEMVSDQHLNNRLDLNSNSKEESESLLSNGNRLAAQSEEVSAVSRQNLNDGLDTSTPGIDIDPLAKLQFNVGGTKFQTLETTVEKAKQSNKKLADPDFLSSRYDETHQEYFFDRDPDVFRFVLNYWRTGKLHLPQTRCGPQLKEELDFWGLKEVNINRCCWNSYHSWMKTHISLDKMEYDMKVAHQSDASCKRVANVAKCGESRFAMWNLLTKPSYSKAAKVYAYIALCFVILGIFSFCASTHKFFQVKDNIDNRTTTTTIATITNSTTISNDTLAATITDNSSMPEESQPNSTEKIVSYYIVKSSQVHPALFIIDIVCVIFFTLEYLLRLICAPKRLRFLRSFNSIVDILAILPDYIDFILYAFQLDLTDHKAFIDFMPFLRLMRAFRIFRLIRRVPGLWIMFYTLKASFKELSLMLIFLLVGTLLFSSIIYFVDNPEVFSSIPQSFWWAIVTMTTVGYGDMTPGTAPGQLVGSVTAVCGVLIIGFTVPSLVNNFITYYNHVEFVVWKAKLIEEAKKDSQRPVIKSLVKNIKESELVQDSEV